MSTAGASPRAIPARLDELAASDGQKTLAQSLLTLTTIQLSVGERVVFTRRAISPRELGLRLTRRTDA